jgi:hypothetical protein
VRWWLWLLPVAPLLPGDGVVFSQWASVVDDDVADASAARVAAYEAAAQAATVAAVDASAEGGTAAAAAADATAATQAPSSPPPPQPVAADIEHWKAERAAATSRVLLNAFALDATALGSKAGSMFEDTRETLGDDSDEKDDMYKKTK